MAESVAQQQVAPVPVTGRRHRTASRDGKGWIFVGPFLAVFALTFLAPIGYAIYLSLYRNQAFFGGRVFVGVDNYTEALQDPKFWEAFGRVAAFLVVQVPIMLALALLAALAID